MSIVMAGTVGIPVFVSFSSLGLEIREAAPRVLRAFCEKQNWSCRRGVSREKREWRPVVMARRGGGGSARSPRPSTSRGPKQQESSRNSTAILRKKTQKETKQEDDEWENNEFDEDALEALFAQLEMDLEAEGLSDNEDITEEEFIELENELAAALEEIEEEERKEEELQTIDVIAEETEAGPEADALSRERKFSKRNKGKSDGQNTRIIMKDVLADGILEEYEDEEEEQRVITLEPWQLRKLAAAVETGRRKVNVKALSAEVGMDRFDVLAWLKNPPPELLMYSATVDDEDGKDELPLQDAASSSFRANSKPAGKEDVGLDPEGGSSWHSQKRLKREHEATFERVFSSTDRPSNAILQNLVELTHVPRKRIVEWFEQRRKEVKASPKFEALR